MQSFILSLLACSVSMSVLALLYIIINPLLAKYSAKTRYYAWLIVILGLIIPYRPQLNDSPAIRLRLPREITLTAARPAENTAEKAAAPVPVSSRAGLPSIWQTAFTIWLLGCLLSLSYQLFRHYKFLKVIKRWGSIVTDEKISELLQELKTDMDVENKIGLYYCPAAGSPLLTGFLQPRIILPHKDFETEELRLILRHELVHFKRKDLYYKNLVMIAASIHWFNPFVLVIAETINTLCEISCDTETLRDTNLDARLRYSETILSVVKRQSKLTSLLSTNFYGGKKGMKKRISSIMDTTKKRIGGAVLLAAVICTVGTGSVFALSGMNSNSGVSGVIATSSADKTSAEINEEYFSKTSAEMSEEYSSRWAEESPSAKVADKITFTDMSAWWDTIGWDDDLFTLSFFIEGYSEISEYGIKCWDENGKEIEYISGCSHDTAYAGGAFIIEVMSPEDGHLSYGLEYGGIYYWTAYAVRDGERFESPVQAFVFSTGEGTRFAAKMEKLNADREAERITVEPSEAYKAYYSRMEQKPRAAEFADEITFTDMSAWWDTGWGDDEFILSFFMEGYSEISEYGIKCWDENGKEIEYMDGPSAESSQANGYFCIEGISPDDGHFYNGFEVGKTYSWIAYAIRGGERIESPVQTFVFSTEGTRFAK